MKTLQKLVSELRPDLAAEIESGECVVFEYTTVYLWLEEGALCPNSEKLRKAIGDHGSEQEYEAQKSRKLYRVRKEGEKSKLEEVASIPAGIELIEMGSVPGFSTRDRAFDCSYFTGPGRPVMAVSTEEAAYLAGIIDACEHVTRELKELFGQKARSLVTKWMK